MTSGGARVRPGPAPQADALRRDRKSDQATWTSLPAAGREGPPPPWPLSRHTGRELERWEAEWAKPQAVRWEADGQADQVAMYVRHFVEAERRGAPTGLRNLVRQEAEILGISETGLARHRWRIDAARPESTAQADPSDVVDIRSRMRPTA